MATVFRTPDAVQDSRAHEAILELVTLSTGDLAAHQDVIGSLLRRTRDYFDLPLAIISRIEGPRYFVDHVIDESETVTPGAEFEFESTYCERVISLARPVLTGCASRSLFKDHPCYAQMGLETYVGVRLFVRGRVYGTLNLSGPEMRPLAFSSLDTSVIEMAASLISHHLSLYEAEERYEAAVRGSSVGLWDWNVRTDELYWSPRFMEIIGLDLEKFTPSFEEFADRLHDDDRDRILLAINAHLSERTPYDVEYRLRHEDGHYVWIHARGQAVWARDGNAIRMAGSVDDITKRREAEDAVRMADQRYQLAIDGANAGIWDWDMESGRQYWSARYCEILGIAEAEPESSLDLFIDRLHPDDRERVEAATERHLKYREPVRLNFRMRHEDGRWIHIRARGQAIWNDKDQAIRMAGSVEDITSQVEDAARLRRQTDELQRTNRELESFAFAASHDLQEPLRKISAYGELLERGYNDQLDKRGQQIISVMTEGAARMQQLIQDLLRYSKSSNSEMAVRDVELETVVDEIANDLDVVIRESSARLETEDLPVVQGDPTLLRQLFQNLISNSIKYSGDTPPHIRLGAQALGSDGSEGWEISVQDNGIGFRPEHSERIFEIFKRLHGKGKYPGTGIGLALCQRIVERHGGSIRAEGVPGEGACFFISLPRVSSDDLPSMSAVGEKTPT
jgi:PAS domain S-box-containing protein